MFQGPAGYNPDDAKQEDFDRATKCRFCESEVVEEEGELCGCCETDVYDLKNEQGDFTLDLIRAKKSIADFDIETGELGNLEHYIAAATEAMLEIKAKNAEIKRYNA